MIRSSLFITGSLWPLIQLTAQSLKLDLDAGKEINAQRFVLIVIVERLIGQIPSFDKDSEIFREIVLGTEMYVNLHVVVTVYHFTWVGVRREQHLIIAWPVDIRPCLQ